MKYMILKICFILEILGMFLFICLHNETIKILGLVLMIIPAITFIGYLISLMKKENHDYYKND